MRPKLIDLIETGEELAWHSHEVTQKLIAMMSAINREKLNRMLQAPGRVVGTIYKRTRIEHGCRVQRAELRDDGIAGCLRTPGGGSSRQFIIEVNCNRVRTRLLTAREAARLMGLPDSYRLPARYNDAYHLAGDGLAIPVVDHLARHVIGPVVDANQSAQSIAA